MRLKTHSSFINNTIIYGIGNIGVLVINFILVPFYTFYLSKSELGYYDFIVTTGALLAPFVTLQIEMAVLRWLMDSDSKIPRAEVIQNSLVVLFLSLSIFSLLYLIFFLIFHFENSLQLYLFFVVYFIYPFLKQIVRGLGKSKQYVFVEIFYTLIFLILAIITIVFLKWNVKGLFISNILAFSIAIIFMLLRNKIYTLVINIKVSHELIKEMLKYSIPLILNVTSLWFMTSAIKYFIVFNMGYSSNGIYSVAYKFASIIQIVNSVFYLSWQEEAFRIYPNKDLHYKFNIFIKKYISFIMFLLLLIIALQPLVVKFIIGKQFQDVTNYIPLISFGFVFWCIGSFYGVLYQCERKTIGLSISALISGFIVIVLNLIFSINYNLYYASLSFILSFMVFSIYRIIDSRKFVKIKFPIYEFIFYSILILIVYFASIYASIIKYIIILLILFIVFTIVNWKNIINFSRYFKTIKI